LAPSIEIICIGTELLIGKTLNTNANWLAKRITSLGSKVNRITVIRDDASEISSSIKDAIQRKTNFIITIGGLGPTFDDKTLEGVAKVLNRRLTINNEALKMIKRKYRNYLEEGRIEKFELTPPRVKMAKLPEGAKPLPNPVGTAPGVLVKRDKKAIISLPGVPSEMKAIFEGSVLPILKRATGNLVFFETSIDATGVVESEMAPAIDRVMHDNPYVYIKSHPKEAEPISRIEFHLSTTAEDFRIAKKNVTKALSQLSEIIQNKGGKIKSTQTEI
jgi:molybdenum cofactor synthesis domain-containing protein